MLKIGDFSKLSQVSIKALRLYDQLGLLKAAWVDPETSYRFYTARQLPRLNRILAYKDLGFSLEQIGRLLDDNLSLAEMQGMLKLKQVELHQQLQEEQSRLTRVAARLYLIEREGIMSQFDIVLKAIQPIRVVSIREQLPNYAGIGNLFPELYAYLGQHQVHPSSYCAALWHDPGYKESDVDGEAVVEISVPLQGNDRIRVCELSGYDTCACLVHEGSYDSMALPYTHLLQWIEQNQYQIIGPNREVYLVSGPEQDPSHYITEIQFPVARL